MNLFDWIFAIGESISRANSHLRYWAYRRQIGSPITLRGALRDWCRRFVFELRQKLYREWKA